MYIYIHIRYNIQYVVSFHFFQARVEDDLYIYEAFSYPQSTIDNHLKLRFKKIQHDLILREKRTKSRKKDPEEFQKDDKVVGKMRYFKDVAGYSGVFICGAYPHWIFITSRGSLRIHPMGIDGPVWCFSEFHNVNCPHGFLYFNKMVMQIYIQWNCVNQMLYSSNYLWISDIWLQLLLQKVIGTKHIQFR